MTAAKSRLVTVAVLLLASRAAAAHIQAWADASGIERACTIGVSPTSGCRGLLATRAVKRNEVLLRVPSKLTISVERDDDSGVDWLTRLALRLAEEIHAGQSSSHAAFVSSLPEPPRAPHQWDADELELLQNATLVREAVARTTLLSDAYECIADRTCVPRATFDRAWELAASRVVGARGARGVRSERLLLVPYLDMANHAHGVGGQLSFDAATGDVMLLAGTNLAVGDEVLLDYGARCSSEFLLQYGFVPDHNPSDEAAVQLADGSRRVVRWSDARAPEPEVRAACERLLDEMPTSLSEDAQELAGGRAQGAHAMALSYRVAKKALLSAVAGHATTSAATSAFARM